MLSSQKNPEKSYTDKKAKHIPSGCALSLTCSLYSTRNQYSYFKFKELALEIINYEEK